MNQISSGSEQYGASFLLKINTKYACPNGLKHIESLQILSTSHSWTHCSTFLSIKFYLHSDLIIQLQIKCDYAIMHDIVQAIY